jgi:S-methylmethionine-dependent homocysteine/selenocysteine methylase
MAQYRYALPQLHDGLFLTDSGLETTLVFQHGRELPCFAAFPLLDDPEGWYFLANYYRRHARVALQRGVGFVLESATWRANRSWAEKLGYSAARLADVNRRAVELLVTVRDELETPRTPMVVSGCVGPRGDGYVADTAMTVDQAREYHAAQIRVYEQTDADLVTAMTMTNVEEATGVVLAARDVNMPVAISFTVETDGRLPTGQPLPEAIDAVDSLSGRWPAYYMINCAHPDHFERQLAAGRWMHRLRGVRANASRRSHAELDAATELDSGNPVELGGDYARLRSRFPWLNVLGGCCGTDIRHVEQIGVACAPAGSERVRV